MVFPIVRGSPYITGIYKNLTPALYTGHAILSVNDEQVPTADRHSDESKCASLLRHHIVLNSGHTVIAYLDREACARWDRNRVVFYSNTTDSNPQPSRGDWVIRVAMVSALELPVLRNSVGILDAFRASIPLSGTVSFTRDSGVEQGHSTSVMRFAWRTVDVAQNALEVDADGEILVRRRTTNLDTKGQHPCELLQLTLPHHAAMLMGRREVGLTYDSIKGQLSGEVGSVWKLRLHHMGSASEGGLPSWNAARPLSAARPEWQEAVRASLHVDARSNISSYSVDAYSFGKEASRLARLALIADELGETSIASSLREKIKAGLTPWLEGTNIDTLFYDQRWGGLVPKHGLADKNADFGAAYFNDHHFHYGYLRTSRVADTTAVHWLPLSKVRRSFTFLSACSPSPTVYASAVLIKDDPAFGEKHREAILALVRDFANPEQLLEGHARKDENLDAALGDTTPYEGPTDQYFPTLRHMDLFDGHSWSNGLFASPNGRNQESSTEAINAYYAISLLGRAMKDDKLTYLGEVLTAIEISGAHRYWHMTSAKSAYGPPFSAAKCVGMVWSDKAVLQTWFATGLTYVHGINLMPITPISEVVFSPEWVQEQYPVLEASLPAASPKVDDAWLGFVHADLAVIDPEEAWRRTEKLEHFDGGASRTNFQYWIATRPPKQ